jgi:lysophospholipase L1-like esterase
VALCAAAPAVGAEKKPYWLDAMKKVHEGFEGTEGYIAQLGDSITFLLAFWSPMGWSDPSKYLPDDGMPKKPEGKRWRDVIKGARAKGGKNGNYSGWRVGNILKVVDKVLAANKPEAAIIMVGTNDIRGGKVPAKYEDGLKTIVEKCIRANCIPILNTIPPMRGRDKAVAECNKIIKGVAAKYRAPLVDYHAAVMKRRPGDAWQGTLISKDGVHPTGGKTQVYDEENLKKSGYALRNWVNFLMYRKLYFKILAAD